VQGLAGSTPAKERLQVILQTMTGTCRVSEACDLLGIGMQRFHQLRRRALLGALAALEPRASGRPARPVAAPAEELAELRGQIQDLQIELRAAQLREEIALVLPHLTPAAESAAKKAKRQRRPR
jgi:hypothetical protein